MNSSYNTHDFREIARLSPPHPIPRLAGVIAKIFPPKRGKNDVTGLRGHGEMAGILQNAFLRDPHTDAEVKVMFADFYLAPDEFQGGFIAFEAVEEGDMVWKAQSSRNNTPVAPKVEIKARVRQLHVISARDYHGVMSLPSDYNTVTPGGAGRSPNQAQFHLESPSGVERAQATKAQVKAGVSAVNPLHEAAKLGFIARLAIEQINASLAAVKPAVDDKVRDQLILSSFVQLTKDGVHHHVGLSDIGFEAPAEVRHNLAILNQLVDRLTKPIVMMMLNGAALQLQDGRLDSLTEAQIGEFLKSVPESVRGSLPAAA